MEMIVNLKEHSYPIYIEKNILKHANEKIKEVFKGKKIMIISDDQVYPLYGDDLTLNLEKDFKVNHVVVPHGEKSKRFDMLPTLYKACLDFKLTRTDLIIALGGGVIGDMAGFVASSYLRGVKLVQIPTSLLAQVDSSVGGKVAVDLPEGKNLVGAFYHPSMVLIDPCTLKTLDPHFISDGMGEVIKYGCIKDSKFSDRMMDYILVKNIEGKYLTLDDFIAENKKEDTTENAETADKKDDAEFEEDLNKKEDAPKTTLFYVTDEVQQSQYINMFKEEGLDAVILKHNIDSPFISLVEQKKENVQFKRIDADVNDTLKAEDAEEITKETVDTLIDVFRKALGKENLDVKVENLKNESVASMITLSEESRRMQDMMKMYNMGGMDPAMFGGAETLVLNAKNHLVQYILEHKDGEYVPMICEQLYDLAMLSHAPLSPEAMTKFIARSNEIMTKLVQ